MVYPAKPDTILVYSGDYRVLLKSVLSSDPNIVKSHIYWDSRTDSVDVDVHRTGASDTTSLVISKLLEGAHTFELVNEDASGNRSVPVFAIGTVYGINTAPHSITGQLNPPFWIPVCRFI
ncbi:hypothetical protein FSB73_20640 [Arachidicoccus ginsenosidivorans]|uniref:Uncharacterized protein n=1 Tax=Arachidicoccus ginsenosidivorans TaxID=496057 RepID=A0A5B8VQ10_9BACT|nr:hypothetical protein FSB73_20640 [Arachidicoccus ginsenosidivorans]